jgi:hypothetical protein
MYAIAETLASRIRQQEEYIAATPAIAILPWFFAGALFPISVLPGALAAFAKVLPLTHAMALLRYGFVDPKGTGLHDIWGLSSTTAEAWLSLAIVVLFTAVLSAVAVRSFKRSAVSLDGHRNEVIRRPDARRGRHGAVSRAAVGNHPRPLADARAARLDHGRRNASAVGARTRRRRAGGASARCVAAPIANPSAPHGARCSNRPARRFIPGPQPHSVNRRPPTLRGQAAATTVSRRRAASRQ